MQINNRSNPPIIMESAKRCSSSSSLLLFLFLLASSTACLSSPARKPCKSFSFFFHDILYNGQNAENATSAIVAAPEGANRTILAGEKHFGNVVVFDDPVTAENHLRSPPIGRAQGLYLYDRKDVYTAWFGVTFVLDSAEHGRGTINIAGADPLMNKTRDVSVVGGTGDFFMARGVATLSTDAFEGEVYFRLKVDVNLYECWLN